MAKWSGNTLGPQKRSDAGWAHQIRSYVQGRGVKDLRTGTEADFDATVDGNIDDFLREGLAWRGNKPRSPKAIPE